MVNIKGDIVAPLGEKGRNRTIGYKCLDENGEEFIALDRYFNFAALESDGSDKFIFLPVIPRARQEK